jgi:hypothetical protein
LNSAKKNGGAQADAAALIIIIIIIIGLWRKPRWLIQQLPAPPSTATVISPAEDFATVS